MKLPWSHNNSHSAATQAGKPAEPQPAVQGHNDTAPASAGSEEQRLEATLMAQEREKEAALVQEEQQEIAQHEAATTTTGHGKAGKTKKKTKETVAMLYKAGEEGKLVLRTDNLVKRYGNRTVANHVSINVRQGEIVGLLGPNGAGKTTTFYMTTGLVTPNEGRVFLNNIDITRLPVYKRAKLGIGYLPQEASVFRTLTVENNIRLVLEMTGQSAQYQKDKLEELIAEFHLEKVRKNLGNRLSGGERRRCEIARCLAINPRFIMLDEPFAGVDPIAVEDIQSIVYHLKSKNIGILITDHNAPETLSITDRAYLLFEGKILFQGSSEELAENPVVREKYLGRNFVFRRKNFDDM